MPPDNSVPGFIKNREAPDFLKEAAAIFESRNDTYGASYQTTGEALRALFCGTIPQIDNDEKAQQLYLLTMCLIKMKRYAQNLGRGHKDSADDLMVYAAMLREATKENDNDGT